MTKGADLSVLDRIDFHLSEFEEIKCLLEEDSI